MLFEENGARIDDLKLIISRVAYASSLFDDDGIQIRFMNNVEKAVDHVKNEEQVQRLISGITFKGLTPLGTQLREQVIDGIVLPKVRSGTLRKPVLVITITDGQPAGEPLGTVFDTIRYASTEMSRYPHYGQRAISYQFAQVGNDQKAKEFLARLDSDPGVGELVDCTSSKPTIDITLQQSLNSHSQILKTSKRRCLQPTHPLT